ncbi:DNA polymerase III subunit gamma and tau [Thermobifida halotolerans]|uniref:DNA polymerase III subunit gamma/tau n=1 Tax=Thermobifida halotolerans TaxID=483545 RepID=A0AA97M3K5_9ACTN|nr:DNA polymerase III subunit gamma and tau [Thermobifida halotolerans]UOE19082.1 DNA polymerase III subunit gamma and tau [Thermobifida halotolerans]
MSIALYRKYRPATFAEVRGQEHVTEPLRQALRNGRVNHAYLFSGPRGCGKTSSARILARSLNCEKGPTPDPCGVCESCVSLAPDGGGSIDVIEIDAASHGGVDDARDLRERAFFAPVNSRYKVYIIDEAHMVTREGFNALLKLVEEPPPHLKFVFATTEPEKVIGTIRSRTHHYPFRLIPPSTLRELMEEILTEEGVPYDPAALPLVVRAGGGSARDSLSILDQLLAGSDERGITREGAVQLLGYTDSGLLGEMVDALGARDGAAVFGLIDRVVEGGHDPRRFAADLLERTRDLVVLNAVPDALDKGLINVPPDAVEQMREQAGRLGAAQLTRAAEILNRGLTEMRGTTSPRLLLELMCSRILLPAVSGPDDELALAARLERLERGGVAPAPPAPHGPAAPAPAAPPAAAQPAPGRPSAPEPVARPEPPAPARPRPAPADDWGTPPPSTPAAAPAPQRPQASASDGSFDDRWPYILDYLASNRKRAAHAIVRDGVRATVLNGRTLVLYFETDGLMRSFVSAGRARDIAEAVQQVCGLEVSVEASTGNPGSAPRVPQAAPPRRPQPVREPAAPPAARPPDRGSAPPDGSAEPRPEAGTGWDDVPAPPSRHEPPARSAPPSPAPEPDPGPAPAGGSDPAPVDDSPHAPEDAVENDLDESAFTGSVLIENELGGKLIEEIDHTR